MAGGWPILRGVCKGWDSAFGILSEESPFVRRGQRMGHPQHSWCVILWATLPITLILVSASIKSLYGRRVAHPSRGLQRVGFCFWHSFRRITLCPPRTKDGPPTTFLVRHLWATLPMTWSRPARY